MLRRRLIVVLCSLFARCATAQQAEFSCNDLVSIATANAPSSGSFRLVCRSNGTGRQRVAGFDLATNAWFIGDSGSVQLGNPDGSFAIGTMFDESWRPATPAELDQWGVMVRYLPNLVLRQIASDPACCVSVRPSESTGGMVATVRITDSRITLPRGILTRATEPDLFDVDIDPLGRVAGLRLSGKTWWVYTFDKEAKDNLWIVPRWGPENAAWVCTTIETSARSRPDWFTPEAAMEFARANKAVALNGDKNLLQLAGLPAAPTPGIQAPPPQPLPGTNWTSVVIVSSGLACFVVAFLIWRARGGTAQ